MRKTYRRRNTQPKQHLRYPINENIRVPEVMVIDGVGGQLGVLKTPDAISKAKEDGLDLVLVGPKGNPPVAKMMDQGKFKYEQEKQLQKQKAKQKKVDTKGIRLSFKMGEHDKELRKSQAEKFLSKGHKVKIEMLLRGRERQFRKPAVDILNSFVKELGEGVIKEQDVTFQGAKLSALISLKK